MLVVLVVLRVVLVELLWVAWVALWMLLQLWVVVLLRTGVHVLLKLAHTVERRTLQVWMAICDLIVAGSVLSLHMRGLQCKENVCSEFRTL